MSSKKEVKYNLEWNTSSAYSSFLIKGKDVNPNQKKILYCCEPIQST